MEDANKDQVEEQKPKTNNYEKVIIASKLARKINTRRQAAKEQMSPEELAEVDKRKVTTMALDELKANKVEFELKKPESDEETYDLT